MYGSGFGDTHELPPYENYTMGGLGSVAGYEANGLGPKDSRGRSLGGSVGVNANISVLSPLPFSEDARAAVFVDGGNVFKNHLDLGEVRYSVGLGLLWNVAGSIPLQFALAKALNPGSTDRTQNFEFTIGSSF